MSCLRKDALNVRVVHDGSVASDRALVLFSSSAMNVFSRAAPKKGSV